MAESPLDHLRILDVSDSVAGQFATRLFADYGAEVVLVEPPGGCRLRTDGTTAPSTGEPAVGHSLLFDHLNGGKGSVVVDSDDLAGFETLVEATRNADVVVVSDRALGTNLHAEVTAEGGDTIVCIVSEFAADGPYADWRGGELVHQALSGSMYYTGLADREPLFGVGRRSSYATGLFVYLAVASALHARLECDEPTGLIEINGHEAAAAMEQNFSTQFAYNGTYPERGETLRPKGRAQCKDGWVIYFARPGQWPEFCRVFDADHLIDDARFATWNDLITNWAQAADALAEAATRCEVAKVFEAARQKKLVLAPMISVGELWREPHLAGRSYWQQRGPERGWPVALGPVFRPSRTPWRRDRPPPSVGDRGASAWEEPAATDATSRSDSSRNGGGGPVSRRPLDGVRVLDFTSAWAGPMSTRFLALLGADVIKIEGPGRPDSWRGVPYDPPTTPPYPDLEPGERAYNRHCWFNSQNHDKRSAVVDIKQPEGLQLVHELAATADVAVANWSPGALDRVGLGYEALSELNERIIVVEMPAISADGPLASMRGLGPTMEAMSGIAALIGYPDGRPLGSGSAYLDPTGALHGAAAVLTALLHRDLTGLGQHVEVAQREAAMHWIGEYILDAIATGANFTARGNESNTHAPFGAFRAAGDDEWIAISVAGDADWNALCEVLGVRPDDARFDTHPGRLAATAALERWLNGHTRGHDKADLARRLQAAGVAAAPVQNGRDLHHDPQLRSNGWFTRLNHADAGTHDYPGLPFVFGGRRLTPNSVSPRFGEHTTEVLTEVLGLQPADLDRLRDRGVIADRPRERT